jgi:hypothetical protein
MTRKEKKALLDAAELIATYKSRYSCCAINEAEGALDLSCKYSAFYGQRGAFWEFGDCGDRVGCRILLVLLFREVGLKGIGL